MAHALIARPIDHLNWSVDELQTMLAQRLSAYSNGSIQSFDALLESDARISAHMLVAYLGAGSPRDCIRLCGNIISEELARHVGA